ncbi:hypothetical protein C8J57DRAFT_1220518 [Mycena rebaudengoi]|nr:hypothetical protein C8J57DRAFT_1220518 [Mycena rebaudengoi]
MSTLTTLIHYTTIAATAVKDMAESAAIPFLGSTAALSLSVLKCVESVRTYRQDCVHMVEQIHEILCSILKLYSMCEPKVLPTALLYDIGKFTETLQKVLTFLKAQQRIGKIKGFFRQTDSAVRLEVCKQELNHTLDRLKVQVAGSTHSQMIQMKKDAQEHHEELVALLKAHPNLTSSEHSSVIGTLSSHSTSSESFTMLPPAPKIFHGREPELEKLVQTLMQDSARITILGTGGMGKTSLAIAALHDPQVQAKYPCQYFVSCNSVPSCTELVSTIAEHIQVEKGAHLAKRVAHYFAHAPPTLLVLDNLETPWEPPSLRAEVEEFLSLLTDVLHLGLLTFLDEADDFHEEDSVKNLLDLTGNLPLAVSLIASVASYEGCDKALLRWKTESTRMLSDGYDQRSSLGISIMLSFTSSRMTTGAQELLSALSMLPDGLTASELVQTQLAIPDILECRATLLQTSLAFVDKYQKLKVLTPIREHILSVHPPSSTLKLKLRQHFHEITNHWIHFRLLNGPDILSQISQNLGNFNSVFLDGLNTEIPDGIQNIQSILFLNRFYTTTQLAFSPLLQHLSEHMLHSQNSPILGDYLIECFAASHMLPVEDAENRITFGNQYFSTKSPLEQVYYGWQQSNVTSSLEYSQRALSLSESAGCPTRIGYNALSTIVQIMFIMGNPLDALEHAKKAHEYAEYIGDCQALLANFAYAQILLRNARDLLNSCGPAVQGQQVDINMRELEAEMHLQKTEFAKSMSSLSSLDISLIDITTGVDTKLVCQRMDISRRHSQELYGFAQTHVDYVASRAYAELHLQDGDHSTAHTIFAKCFASQGLFLGLALQYKDKLATFKAFVCLGQIFAAQGDEETALSLFDVALDAFTSMDVHRWRAICMVQTADILEKQGEVMKSVGLWKAARPLFERCSQAKDVLRIDLKLKLNSEERLETAFVSSTEHITKRPAPMSRC